ARGERREKSLVVIRPWLRFIAGGIRRRMDHGRSGSYNFRGVGPYACCVHEDFIAMPKVTFVKEKQDIEVPAGANLRDEARKANIPVNFQLGSQTLGKLNCFGHGSCGSCHVLVKKGLENLSPKGRWEQF